MVRDCNATEEPLENFTLLGNLYTNLLLEVVSKWVELIMMVELMYITSGD